MGSQESGLLPVPPEISCSFDVFLPWGSRFVLETFVFSISRRVFSFRGLYVFLGAEGRVDLEGALKSSRFRICTKKYRDFLYMR